MSEIKATYKLDNTKSIRWFKKQNFCLEFSNPDFVHPTFQDIKELRKFTGWSHSTMAEIAGINFIPGNGSSTIRKWCSDPASSNHARKIPYATWRLFLITAGIVEQKIR
jgi:hypothetical protein